MRRHQASAHLDADTDDGEGVSHYFFVGEGVSGQGYYGREVMRVRTCSRGLHSRGVDRESPL